MTRLVKRIGIFVASLCCGVAVVCGMIGMPTGRKAVASGTTIASETLVEGSSTMTVTPAYENAGLFFAQTDTFQSAKLSGTFNGDLTLEYSLLKNGAPACFDFCTVDGTRVFRVIRYAMFNDTDAEWASAMYVAYQSSNTATERYTYLDSTEQTVDSEVEPTGGVERQAMLGYALPVWAGSTIEQSGTGTITLNWSENNQLAIKASYVSGEKTVATLDLSAWEGLSSAYGLRFGFHATFERQENVLLRSVNGVSLAGETVACESVATGISYDGEKLVGSKPTIEISKGESLKNFGVTSNTVVGGNWTVASGADSTFAFAEDFSVKDEGTYAITVAQGSFMKNYDVVVMPTKNVSDLLITASGVRGAHGVSYNDGAVVGYQALCTEKENNGDIVRFNGVFNEDFELEYFLPDPDGAQDRAGEGIVFYVEDTNGNFLFKVEKRARWGGNAGVAWEHFTYVYDTDYTLNEDNRDGDGALAVASRENDYPVNGSTVNDGVSYQYATGKIQFAWGVNGVTVSTTNNNATTLSELATLSNVMLPTDGYKVTVKSTWNGYVGGVVLCNVNGRDLSEEQVCVERQSELAIDGFFDGETLYVPKNGTIGDTTAIAHLAYADGWTGDYEAFEVNSWLGAYDLTSIGTYTIATEFTASGRTLREEVTLIVEPSNKITFDAQGGTSVADIYYSEHTYQVGLPTSTKQGWEFLGWYNGTQKVEEITLGLGDVTLCASWLDDKGPEIALNGLESITTIEKGTAGGLSVATTDITALDEAWGNLSGESITISVKAPNVSTFESWNTFVFNDTNYGVYTVKYTATDGSGNASEITRNIRYIPVRPTMQISAVIPENSILGKKITLPTASAECGGTVLNVALSVVFENEEVALVNGAFTPLSVGEYTIVYSAMDEYERYVAETFVVSVVADTQKPVISVTFETTTLFVGDTLSLPTATALDDADGQVAVSVAVQFNGGTVATSDFVVNEKGVYTVVYTAKDSAGNESIASFEVVVGENVTHTPTTEMEKEGGNGLVWLFVGIGGTVVIGGGVCAFIIIRKKKNKEK